MQEKFLELVPPDLDLDDEALKECAKKFRTPFFVYDEGVLRRRWELLRGILPSEVELLYSVKANPCVGVVGIFARSGAGFDISSAGELKTVRSAGGEAGKCVWVAPAKSAADHELARQEGVGVLVADSCGEVRRILERSWNGGGPLTALRINPGSAGGGLSMGGATQFGVDTGTAARLLSLPEVKIGGIHGFLGTRLLDCRALAVNLKRILDEADGLEKRTKRKFTFVDAGGGFGVPLYPGEGRLDVEALGRELRALFASYRREHPWCERLAVESGRFLAAEAGVMVARVVDVKCVHGRKFVLVDGGINSIGGRDAYWGARHPPVGVVGKSGVDGLYTICGPLCTPMDRLAVDAALPRPRVGDLLKFYLAGAYCSTASPGRFLSRGFAAEIIHREGRFELSGGIWGEDGEAERGDR